ncbi:MAG: YkgJ family cysteine cluster protein [Armatimonadetes bacterium]|nr:YkgJ family cysteine cluster protein [Armatimonadota bacterium]
MRRSLPIVTPSSSQRYDCHLCGACCRAGFAVVVTDEERERIRGQGWESEPEFRGRPLFIRQIGGQHILAQRDDGACLFLGEDQRCRIHAKFGAEGKPFACRPYPFIFLPMSGQMRVGLRFDCPSVAASRGRPLAQHHADLAALSPQAVPAAAAALPPPPFRPGIHLDWHDLFRVSAALDRIVAAESLDITRRVLAWADVAGVLGGVKMDGLEGRALSEFLDRVVGNRLKRLPDDPLERKPLSGFVPPLFRQAVGLYGRLDRVSDTRVSPAGKLLRAGQRLAYSLRLLAGSGRMPRVRPGLPQVPFRAVERSFGVPSPEAAEVLTRYYRVKLGSLGFFGRAFYGWGYLEGLGALLLTYPLILWYARLFAIGEGTDAISAETVQQAVRVVDRPRGVAVPLGLRTERARVRFLCDHENLTRLIIWYGS